MSFLYWLSKFSHEAMLVELFLISFITAMYFGYLLLHKRKYGAAKKNIPDHIVREFLAELISYCEGFKNQLFGEEFKILLNNAKNLGLTAHAGAGADAAEVSALKAALAQALAKQEELQKLLAALTKDKAAVDAKLAAGASAPAAAGGDPNALKELNDKIAKLESRLAEYEVIEDDLANLKKYQQENKQLRSQLEALQKGGAAPAPTPPPEAAAPPPPAPAPEPTPAPAAQAAPPPPPAPAAEAAPPSPPPPAPEPTPVAAAEESAAAAQAEANFDKMADKVEESLPPAGASAVDPAAAAAAQTAPPSTDVPPAPAPAGETLAAAAAPPAAEPKGEKTDADLLNEFERMLSS